MKKYLYLLSAIILFSVCFVGCGTAVPDREILESTTVTEPEITTEITTSTKVETTSKVSETTTEPKEKTTIATTKTVSSSASKTSKRAENKVTVKPTEKEKTATTTKKAVTTEVKKAVVYSCGCKNHHCQSKEDHEFVIYLENKGCDICGSHSCPSFYALDEWGQQCYDISKCPQYMNDDINYYKRGLSDYALLRKVIGGKKTDEILEQAKNAKNRNRGWSR